MSVGTSDIVMNRALDISKKRGDSILLLITLLLLGIGIVMIYSASNVIANSEYGGSMYFLKRQLFKVVLGLLFIIFFARFDYHRLLDLASPILLGTFGLLLIVLIPGIGGRASAFTGAKRWINLGFLNLQPLQVAKLTIIIYFAAALTRKEKVLESFEKGILPLLLILSGIFGLLILEPAFGAAFTIVSIGLIMLYIGGARLYHLISMMLGAIPILLITVTSASYRFSRLMTFFNPNADPLNKGYQIRQSLLGLGSGGLLGVGLGQSHQKLFYLPEPYTDFIFSVIGEELGYIGTITVLILYLILAWRGMRIAMQAPDRFGYLLATGMSMMLFISAMINIGVTTGTLPTTGLPLPFISYGGSSLLFTCTAIGILLNISRWSVEKEKRRN